MTQVDHEKQLALVIIRGTGEGEVVVADARYLINESGQTAELALLVEDRWQRRGLGERAVLSLVKAARRAGLLRLRGQVLRRNAAMLALARRCGFARTSGAEDARAVAVERKLGDVAAWATGIGALPLQVAPSASCS
jgi:acetyltransferase